MFGFVVYCLLLGHLGLFWENRGCRHKMENAKIFIEVGIWVL